MYGLPNGAKRTAADIALTTEKESAQTNERPAGEPAPGEAEPRLRTEPEVQAVETLIPYAAQVPFAEPVLSEAAAAVVAPTAVSDETEFATDDSEFLSYAASTMRRSSATTARDAPHLPTDDALPTLAVTSEVEVSSVESVVEEPASPAVEPVGVSEAPTAPVAEPVANIEVSTGTAGPQIAEPVDVQSVSLPPADRDVPPVPAADDGRSPRPARDWLLARMEQAAAAHAGVAPGQSERSAHPPSIAERVREIRPPLIEPATQPPAPPPPPPPVYQAPRPPPVYDAPPLSQPAYEPPPPPPREPRPIAPAYRAPEPPPEPIAAVASADTFAPTEYDRPAPSDVAPPADVPPTLRGLAWRVGRYAAYAVGGYLALVLALILVYRSVDPPASTLMLYEGAFGAGARQTWVPLERISPNLVRAVIVAEDGRFCDHHGIDFAAIGEAIENADDGIPRGASTISMQVTKNLFLWQSKSYIRKLIELPLTLIIEVVWPKSRVLEIYLNIAEWGPGVFGAEAAAQHHFNRSASTLSEREAAQLAAALPNPILRDAGDPGPRLQRKAAVIQNRARASGDVVFCVKSSR